tara:strand:+ start:809 stop:1810 length:1002 start_codon:yes stop_codon:yes gene_type:complete
MTLVIAEAGVNHNGDIGLAKELIYAAKESGADIVKFQTFKTELGISTNTPLAPYQAKKSDSFINQYELVKKLELEFDSFFELKECAEKSNIEFLSTAFDLPSIKLLADLNLKRHKIPSGEIDNYPYLREISKLGKPIILSTGMSNLSEIEFALNTLIKYGTERSKITVMHCVTEYPAPINFVNLNAMKTISDSFNVEVGYSDHTEGIYVPISAAILGAKIIEKHLTLDRKMEGPDHLASIEPSEFKKMTTFIKRAKMVLGDGVKEPKQCELKNIKIVRKSIFAKTFIRKGEMFTEKNLITKRPGKGISPRYWNSLIGKISKNDYLPDEIIKWQ